MNDDTPPHDPSGQPGADQPGAVARARGFAGRARRTPGTVEDIARATEAARAELHAGLDEVRATLARLEQLGWDGRSDTRGGVEAVGSELHRLRAHVDAVGEQLAALDGTVTGQAAATRRTVQAPARAAAAAALRQALGPAPELRPGLSVFTLCWDHGELLPSSVASALAALDRLPEEEQGEVLVLDDASTDSTPEVAAGLAAADPRVRVIRSEENLGLAHARSTLLHAARTRHALQLDADDLVLAEGLVDLYRMAVRTGATATFGTVVQAHSDGTPIGPVSNEPPTPGFFLSNYIGTIAVSDVAAYRALGGWPTDPLLEHVDDWASLHHVIASGRLLAFVPTVAAVYQEWPTGFHHSVPDPRLGRDRIGRVFDPTGRHRGDEPMTGVAAVAIHPETGPLWATPEAIALDPALAPTPPPAVTVAEPSVRVLLVGPGGVANLGDDAITVGAVARARAAFGKAAAIDVVTDGQPQQALGHGARWLAPLDMALHGLDPRAGGDLPPVLADAPDRVGVGRGRWRPLDPSAYDIAVVVGYGLSSRWAEGTIVPRALLAHWLRAAGVPVALSGQGYVIDDADTDLLATLVAGSVAVGCRDRASADRAAGLPGVDPAVVALTGDDALGLPATTADRPDRPYLAVTVRRAGYVGDPADDPTRRWAIAADALAAERGWDVLGVALNDQPPEPEVATLAQLRATTPLRARWHVVQCGADPGRLVAAVAGADAVATQSYHAALFALAAGVPAVLGAASPYYGAKAGGLATLAGLPSSFAVEDLDALPAALDAVASALAGGAGLTAATAAVDTWWSALPTRLTGLRANFE